MWLHHSFIIHPKFQSWYKVDICTTDDLYEIRTIDDVKIKPYLVLKIIFSLPLALKS